MVVYYYWWLFLFSVPSLRYLICLTKLFIRVTVIQLFIRVTFFYLTASFRYDRRRCVSHPRVSVSSGLSLCLSYSHGGSVTVSVIVSLCLSQYQRLCQSLCRSLLSLCGYVSIVCLRLSPCRCILTPTHTPPILSLSESLRFWVYSNIPWSNKVYSFIHLLWSKKVYSFIHSLLISAVVADSPVRFSYAYLRK